MKKKVSIIVPIYKVEKYLERCINSILCQSYKNLEIILVDDGSPDLCGAICEKYALKDSRIKVIHKENGGLSDARNVGMRHSTGEFLAFVDSDDWIACDMIEKAVSLSVSNDADIVSFGFYKTDGKSKSTVYTSGQVSILNHDKSMVRLCENKLTQSHAWDKLFRREVICNVEFPAGKLYEDVFMMHQVFDNANKVVFYEAPLYYYFQRDDSIVSQRTMQSYLDLIEGFEKRKKDLKKYGDEIQILVDVSILRAALDALRIIADSGVLKYLDEYVRFKEIVALYKKRKEVKNYLSKSLKIDMLILLGLKTLYIPYRKNIRIIKQLSKKENYKLISRNIRIAYKRYCKSISRNNFDCMLIGSNHRIVLMGSPEYNNLGDHAIAYATRNFWEKDYDYMEISEYDIFRHLRKIKKIVKNSDILLLQGGGNISDLYMDQQKIREIILKHFPKNKIIMMPQSLFFSDGPKGKEEAAKTKLIYNKHKNLHIFARDRYSQKKMCELFQCECGLAPDIVLSVKQRDTTKRNGVAICIRDDVESVLDLAARDWLFEVCKERFTDIKQMDTCFDSRVLIADRERVLNAFWEEIRSKELLITDRLHGMIFAAINGTRCVAITNSNDKIKGVYEWIKSTPWIVYTDNIYCVQEKISEVMSYEPHPVVLDKEFNPLRDIVKEDFK